MSKVEGTKLIIQKKALTLNTSVEHTPGAKIKKPRISKKLLQTSQMSSSLMAVEANPAESSADPNQAANKVPKLKIINKDKQKNPSLILKIPKENLVMASQEPGEVGAVFDQSGKKIAQVSWDMIIIFMIIVLKGECYIFGLFFKGSQLPYF